jgi:hypothetical protein
MTTFDEVTEFHGLPVVVFPADPKAEVPSEAADPGRVAWRLDCHAGGYYGDLDFAGLLENFLARIDGTKVAAIVTGQWDDLGTVNPAARILAAAADRLPALRAVFLAEIPEDDYHVSWILNPAVNPVLDAYPALSELWVRGAPHDPDTIGTSRIVRPTRHEVLRTLVVQSGQFVTGTARAISECEFPELTHLEIFFGDINYPGDPHPSENKTLDDIQWLLDGSRVPNLRHLGLKNSPIQDEIATALAHAPVVAHLEVLDLSLGTLGDEGAAALLAGQPLTHLRRLDLTHHFLTAAMQQRLLATLDGVDVRLSDTNDPQHGRYVAIDE